MENRQISKRSAAVLILLVSLALIAFGVGCSSDTKKDDAKDEAPARESTVSSWQDAVDIAMEELNLSAADVEYSSGNSEHYEGEEAYKVVLVTSEIRYVVFVSTDGQILATEQEPNLENPAVVKAEGYISLDEAKQIALGQANLNASDVTFTKAELDENDGVMTYEIDFETQKDEFECEINARTGDIIKFEKDER